MAATRDPGKQARLASGIPVVPAFDGYRAYAIMGILFLHVIFGSLPAAGDNGLIRATLGQCVDVLFIVSGFVVFLPTVARGGEFGSVRAYAIRRAARLVPAYWAILGIILLLGGLQLGPARLPSLALALRTDVTDFDSQEALVAAALDRFGHIDAAFANAGFGAARGFLKEDPEQWRQMVLTNVLGVAYTIRAVMPHFSERRAGH